ncbi:MULTISPECIES: hypothetical protein [unclassified Acidiplasma]|uniref:hypothetical protein n=1 Tax=unclassified Acidiplasma TaxID=2641301 RepID=UPI0005DC25FE|nr:MULTISPECIES: hypothetical protein [unclassified Acidiplasma]KJE49121.1 hypothetical protein TZ01_03235 [Acidiplasma sp. MBA-1]WMT54945.1 MAG: hypothetical protein RE470_08530 [Acidiplasma sp.]
MVSLEESCVFNRGGICYFLESSTSKCSLCFNFKSFTKYGSRRKIYYNLFDYIKSTGSQIAFPKGDEEQETLE